MANSSLFGEGKCPPPFLPELDYPPSGGYIEGRYCAPITLAGGISCCLPCPQTNWVYGDNFDSLTQAANYINVVGVILCVFLLLSFALLPVEKTHRHYLSVCLLVSIILMQLGFIIPLGTKPHQCHDAVTPNDMYSNGSCAVSGFFLLAGGWCGVMWVFMRALTLHLQICWQVITGKKFFISALAVGWGIPILFVAVSLGVTGVSYRFGDTCHINHENALGAFWGPLLAFAAATAVIQFATFGYCIKVYLRSLMEGPGNTTNSSALPSYSGSIRTMTARQTYKRVRRVVELQWRGIAIVLLILTDVVFFAVIFLYLDNAAQKTPRNFLRSEPWLVCLIFHNGDKNQCLDLAAQLTVNEATVMAVLILLSSNGIWCMILLGQWAMFGGWVEYIRSRFHRRREFVSVDARRFSATARTYEMLQSPPQGDIKTPDAVQTPPLSSADVIGTQAQSPDIRAKQFESKATDYFTIGAEKTYSSPHLSFSSPRAPSQTRQVSLSDGRPASRALSSGAPSRTVSMAPSISTTTPSGSSTFAGREWDPSVTHAKSVINRPANR